MGTVAFYVTAHQDDWQLFHGQQAWSDTKSGARIVFIYLTGGMRARLGPDGGRLANWCALESCRLITGPNPLLWKVAWFNGRPITGCDCGNTSSFFLRLPDGSLNGLRTSNTAVGAIDGSTQYSGWDDVCNTLKAILDQYRNEAGQDHPWVNTSDYDLKFNPSPPDNPDHVATGYAVQQATAGAYNRVWWVGYDVAQRPANLSVAETDQKRQLQQAYTGRILQVMTDAGNPVDDWANAGAIYETWLNKDYVRADNG